jgi:protoporphyrinogen oxidase
VPAAHRGRAQRGGDALDGKKVVVLGAGLSGLGAGNWLAAQRVPCEVLERGPEVGGLARTLERNGYRFDFGGARFFGSSSEVRELLRTLLGEDLLTVEASSRIYYRGRLYTYPLEALDIVRGMGWGGATGVVWSLVGSRLPSALPFSGSRRDLERWLIREFGETLYHAFFKNYNEKVWGEPCHQLSAELASRRIRGLDVVGSIKRAVAPGALADGGRRYAFLYPRFGIGQLSRRLATSIEDGGVTIRRSAAATELIVRRARVETVLYRDRDGKERETSGTDVISAIPLPRLLHILNPPPPADVLASARSLQFRDMITVCLEVARERVTTDSWLYVPEPRIGFARLLEPKNWSESMAPPGRTSLVAEYYCREGDATWDMSDQELVERTTEDVAGPLGLIDRSEVLGGCAIRIKKAYPVYTVHYREHLRRIQRYLGSIVNLQTVGRGGLFRYHNVAHLLEIGIRAAENVFGAGHDLYGLRSAGSYSGFFPVS